MDFKDWKFERVDHKPFKRIFVETPDGYRTIIDSIEDNPGNILFKLVDYILKQQNQ